LHYSNQGRDLLELSLLSQRCNTAGCAERAVAPALCRVSDCASMRCITCHSISGLATALQQRDKADNTAASTLGCCR
jgi:hypothetical protein